MYSVLKPREIHTIEDLEALETDSNDRYELINGQIVLMGKASINHGILAKNISNLIDEQIKYSPCFTVIETVEVEIKNEHREDRYRPDVTLICPPYDGEQSVIDNPKAIVEVLSKSSILLDTNDKREGYLEIESLKAYIVVSQWKKEIYVYLPKSNGYEYTVYKEGEVFELKDWFKLDVDSVFKGVL